MNFTQFHFTGWDLSNCDLQKAEFGHADLKHSLLRSSRLSDAGFHEAVLRDVDLAGADLTRAKLTRAILDRTDLSGAKLVGATLWGTYFSATMLNKANLSKCVIAYARFDNVDLSLAMGLEDVIFQGPCSIGFDTIDRSHGTIPLTFLRGCGLPNRLIEKLPALLGTPGAFDSCFISHSTIDQAFAERLRADLQDKSVTCWFALTISRAARS